MAQTLSAQSTGSFHAGAPPSSRGIHKRIPGGGRNADEGAPDRAERGPGRPALGNVVFVALTGLTKQPLMARTGHGEAPITTRSIYHVKAPLLLTFSVIAALCRARLTPRDFSQQLRVPRSHHTFNHQRHEAQQAPEARRKFGYNPGRRYTKQVSLMCVEKPVQTAHHQGSRGRPNRSMPLVA